MTQASDRTPAAVDTTGNLAQAVPAGKAMSNMNLTSLLTTVQMLLRSTGVLRVETLYHSWKLLIWGGSIALIDEEAELVPTLQRKLRIHKLRLPSVEALADNPRGVQLYEAINQIYLSQEEQVRPILKEILFENLLAIYLETSFTATWYPMSQLPELRLPIWKFPVLDDVAKRAVEQWKLLQHIRHPYQTVQLLDQNSSIANLPLFAKVTNGKFRISEIADEFKQPISRTAQKLDKLAEARTVAILPLIQRQARSQQDQDTDPDTLADVPQILVVDDSPVQLKQFGDLLKSWGYRIHLVSDPHTVRQTMLECKPDLVFIDINMPISGFELIKEIRREAQLKDTPLVLVTSADNMANKFRANWAHCKFLPKPKSSDSHHVQEFRDQLRRILREVAPLPTDALV